MNFDFSADPFLQLDGFVKQAAEKGLKDPNAMALATATEEGKPSVRIVLYKGLIRGGLSFYTNYEGRKGRELAGNPFASVCFFWPTLDVQIRVEGEVAPLTRDESEAYFRTRARLSQVGAWASHQSETISGTAELQAHVDEIEKRFQGREIPCPPHWGGFHLIPSSFEFWFNRSGRLHERFCFLREGSGWKRLMKSP
ncbi:MAG TPA: pyridoxamine 5'-phosphate oxidase [Pseudobdellovibrionaceae bacterium]|nr:pyridoxamine 5'-phosphate oxidase [Pseudobdellovibrionaceae bacterium]